jgi:outer membrane protein OmpA-like peptidoglycan-associated protein
MRNFFILLAALLCPAGVARAQVTVDLHALDSLPIGSGVLAGPLPYLPRPAPAPRSAAGPPVTRILRAPQPVAAPPQPALPAETPVTVALTPIVPLPPTAVIAPPPPPPVSGTAATAAKPTSGGLQLTFSATETDLSPASVEAIKQVAGSEAAGTATYNVLAYAAGSPNDPSAARRLSLSRALAVRSALMADGVPSSRIYVRALGSQADDGPADRVDINRLGANAASAKAQ